VIKIKRSKSVTVKVTSYCKCCLAGDNNGMFVLHVIDELIISLNSGSEYCDRNDSDNDRDSMWFCKAETERVFLATNRGNNSTPRSKNKSTYCPRITFTSQSQPRPNLISTYLARLFSTLLGGTYRWKNFVFHSLLLPLTKFLNFLHVEPKLHTSTMDNTSLWRIYSKISFGRYETNTAAAITRNV